MSEDDVEKLRLRVKQDLLSINQASTIEVWNIAGYQEAVNEIITTDITMSTIIQFESNEKMNWAKKGMSLHSEGDKCAFCDNPVSKQRLIDLNSFFNDSVKRLGFRIEQGIEKIDNAIKMVRSVNTIEKSEFYPEFYEQVDEFNVFLLEAKQRYLDSLGVLLKSLKKRKEDIFIKQEPILWEEPLDFSEISVKHEKLLQQNKEYHDNLDSMKKQAQNKLRLHFVYQKLMEMNHSEKIQELSRLKINANNAQEEMDKQRKRLQYEREELTSLLSQTVDETRAAREINRVLKSLGNQSFSLEVYASDSQKGQYQVKGHDGNFRDIKTLSTGEKNIVAFLWFMFDLQNTKKLSSKDKIIVFDDPMTSNDDTVQYAMISELQKLLKKNDCQIFILTHSDHFYTNTRYKWWKHYKKPNYDKSTIHLVKQGSKSDIKYILNEKDDLKHHYDAKWADVKWLYEKKRPDLMINPLRSILEVYANFNRIDEIYESDSEAQKLFNVNSHGVDDIYFDANGKNEEEIIEKVKRIFESVNGKEHFDKYWNSDNDKK